MKKQTTIKTKPKKDNVLKYEKPLSLEMKFDEAIKLIAHAGSPPKEIKK